jgi:nitroimidazol reductase NimA-like FMN-containing flavoprotein (pyridoxamine 5'-phosphate oxidase superfamily)
MRTKFIKEEKQVFEIIDRCDTCFISMVDENNLPYLIPMNFGRDGDIIFLHSAPEGKKIEIINKNPELCIGFSTDHALVHQDKEVACSYFMQFRSVIAYGKAEQINDDDEKIRILNVVMKKYTGKGDFSYNSPAVKNVRIYKVKMREYSAKTMGYN